MEWWNKETEWLYKSVKWLKRLTDCGSLIWTLRLEVKRKRLDKFRIAISLTN